MTVLEVDSTALLIGILTGVASADSDTPANLETALPFLRVVRQGGPDDGVRLDVPTFVLHGFAATEQASQALLMSARSALRAAVGQVRSGATISHFRCLAGPSQVASENPNVAHAFMTVQAHVKDA